MNNEQQLREICQFINRERILTLSVAAEGMVWSGVVCKLFLSIPKRANGAVLDE
ncbi:MAG: hypothetical protein HUK14_11215 [Muribaculaceae bacterium]|nr:hypothetical protein [Muribaculaceae bacterium]MCF0252476.1 hypothetical protein [Shigella flexneri]